MRSHSPESYFILRAKKVPTANFLKPPSWALVLITMLIMVLVARSLGAWWDSLKTGQKPKLPEVMLVCVKLLVETDKSATQCRGQYLR